MKNTQGKTGQTPGRTPEETKRRDQSQPNVRRDESQERNPQETDPKKRPQEPKRFEEKPIKPSQQPQGRGQHRHTTEDKDSPAGKTPDRNINPTDEKYLSEKDQYIPGRKDDRGPSEVPTKSDQKR